MSYESNLVSEYSLREYLSQQAVAKSRASRKCIKIDKGLQGGRRDDWKIQPLSCGRESEGKMKASLERRAQLSDVSVIEKCFLT